MLRKLFRHAVWQNISYTASSFYAKLMWIGYAGHKPTSLWDTLTGGDQ